MPTVPRDLSQTELDRALERHNLVRVRGHYRPQIMCRETGEVFVYQATWSAVKRRHILAWSIALADQARRFRDTRIKSGRAAPGAAPLLDYLAGLQENP